MIRNVNSCARSVIRNAKRRQRAGVPEAAAEDVRTAVTASAKPRHPGGSLKEYPILFSFSFASSSYPFLTICILACCGLDALGVLLFVIVFVVVVSANLKFRYFNVLLLRNRTLATWSLAGGTRNVPNASVIYKSRVCLAS